MNLIINLSNWSGKKTLEVRQIKKRNKKGKFIISVKIRMLKNKIKFMVDRLYENMLILTVKNRKSHCNRTFCNLNFTMNCSI